jgi:hypothetical protein
VDIHTVVAGLGMLSSFMIKRKELSKEHEIVKTGLDIQEQARRERLQEEKEKKQQKVRKLSDDTGVSFP